MARHKKKGARTPDAKLPAPPPTPSGKRSIGEPEVLALAASAICLGLTWFSRLTLNPDGVSYLDLARLRGILGDHAVIMGKVVSVLRSL